MMKVDSSIYTRYSINYPQQPKTENAAQQQSDASKVGGSYKTIASKVNKAAVDAKKVNQLPEQLSDVITPEENQMLQELFNDFGSRWGVDAYRLNDAKLTVGSRGNQIDLIS